MMVFNMKRNKIIDDYRSHIKRQHKIAITFHEAGHATAIYLNNKARNLPPIFFQIVFKEIEAYMWNFASGDGRGMMSVLSDILELFESRAQDGKNVLNIAGEDVSDFCDGILKEVQAQTWTGKKKEILNQTIHRKLGEQAD
jgi:DNA-binding ferritin-like protein (Dps family)